MKKIVIITAALALEGCDEQPQINIEEHVLEELTIVNGGGGVNPEEPSDPPEWLESLME